MNEVGFLGYAVFIFAFTGLLILIEDVKAFKNEGLKKERKTAKILGWVNISFGIVIMLANWVSKQWFW